MSIENRDLSAGTRLVARYKGQEYTAEVVQTEDGIRTRLEDSRLFKSVSSAGSAIMGGTACNGWRFWSLADGVEPATKPKTAKAKATKKAAATFQRLPANGDTPEGQAKFFCNACMDAFTAPAGVEPIGCPKGHTPEEQAAA